MMMMMMIFFYIRSLVLHVSPKSGNVHHPVFSFL